MLLSLEKRLCKVNSGRQVSHALYLYDDLAYFTMYKIMSPYKNNLIYLCTLTQKQFNNIMARLQIEFKYGFAIHLNF